jgi:hypothetical protein
MVHKNVKAAVQFSRRIAVLEGAMYDVNMKRFMVFSKLVSHDGGKIASAI